MKKEEFMKISKNEVINKPCVYPIIGGKLIHHFTVNHGS